MENSTQQSKNPVLARAIRANFLRTLKTSSEWTLPQKKKALHKYIIKKFGVNIPKDPVCENHQPPFEFFAAAFFELYPVVLALGPRLGGKTLDFAILSICEALANEECELANFGAVEKQAMRCYGYIKQFFERNPEFVEYLKGKITLSKTELKNNSWIQILVATMAGVNSPHPQKLKADEVELIPWIILQEAFNMPRTTPQINATTVLGSTRKFAHGPMQRLIDDKTAETFTFCIWEVMEPWPEDRTMQEKIFQAFRRKYGSADMLPQDLSKFNGFFSWQDLIMRIHTLDEETFRAQVLCEKPDSGGLIYPKFDEVLNNDPEFQLDTTGVKQIQIWEDFGYARPDHPDAISFVQVDLHRMEFTIFDELCLFEMGTQDIIIEVIQKLQHWGLVREDLQNLTKQQLLSYMPEGSPYVNYAEFFSRVNVWVPDYHGLTEIKDRQKYGCPIPLIPQAVDATGKVISKMYLKENGIPHVRNFVDDRKLKMVMENTPHARSDFMSYSKRRKPDGTWTDDPEKKNDHWPDNVHYGTVFNWPDLAYQSLGNLAEPTDSVTGVIGGEDVTVGGMFTEDLMDKTF